MKGLDSIIRLRQWELDEKRRKVADLERLAVRLRNEIDQLEQGVKKEQKVAAENTEVSGTYGGYANAVILRRDKLRQSLVELEGQMVSAVEEVAEAFREFKKFDLIKARNEKRKMAKHAREQQMDLDEAGINIFNRSNG